MFPSKALLSFLFALSSFFCCFLASFSLAWASLSACSTLFILELSIFPFSTAAKIRLSGLLSNLLSFSDSSFLTIMKAFRISLAVVFSAACLASLYDSNPACVILPSLCLMTNSNPFGNSLLNAASLDMSNIPSFKLDPAIACNLLLFLFYRSNALRNHLI